MGFRVPDLVSAVDRTAVRLRLPTPEDFRSPVHSPWVVARLGRMAGVALLVCFLTGLVSHNAQDVAGIFLRPWPRWGYRLTQGVHVATGLSAVPLVLAKTYAVSPRLFVRPLLPPPTRAGLGRLARRLLAAALMTSVLFEVTTGVFNINQWYAFRFDFRSAHYAAAWVVAGAVLTHIGMELPVIRRALRRDGVAEPSPVIEGQARERRDFVRGAAYAAGAAFVLVGGQAVRPLSRVALVAPRRSATDTVQGLPVNRTAQQAGLAGLVPASPAARAWRLHVTGPGGSVTLTLTDLAAMTQHTVRLPIACVEGWSRDATWRGVRVRDLIALVGAAPSDVVVRSLDQSSLWGTSLLPRAFVAAEDTLLALGVNHAQLLPDHGFPARIIAPNRPGVLQTKWVARLEVRT